MDALRLQISIRLRKESLQEEATKKQKALKLKNRSRDKTVVYHSSYHPLL